MSMTVPNKDQDLFEAGGRGLQHAGMRRANQRMVLRLVATDPGLFNAEIARRSGLAPQTVSAILTDLEQDHMIRRGEVLRGRRGQPATPIYIDPEAAFSIGCNVGWRHLELVIINMHGVALGKYRRDYDYPDAQTVVDEVEAVVADLRGQLTPPQAGRLVGLGLAAPNDVEANLFRFGAPAAQAAAWAKLDLRAALAKATGLETAIFNDGNAACFAEMVAYPRPRPSNCVYMQVNSFLEAGIVAENQLWEGPTGQSANLGSMLVSRPDGSDTFVFEVASLIALEFRLTQAGFARPQGDPLNWPWHDWTPVIERWLDDAAAALARTIVNTAAVIEVSAAVVDGDLPEPVVEKLLTRVRQALSALATPWFRTPDLRKGQLGGRAAAIGAAQLSLYRKFFAPQNDHLES